MGDATFRRIVEAGVAAVRSGTHGTEGDPRRTGRWGPSLVLLPDTDLARGLADLTASVARILGGSHWLSGMEDRSHVTVRALEPYTDSVPPDRLSRYLAAAERTIEASGPLTLSFDGVGISPGSVMVRARPLTDAAEDLRAKLGTELGDDAWFEDAVFERGRDPVWYCSILHYAEPVTRVDDLLAWVESQHDVSLGSHTFDALHLCCWSHDGSGMVPRVAGSVSADAHP